MHEPEGRQARRQVRLYGQSTSARCVTVMYHSPNRWGESHKTAVTLIKARFLTLIVGNQARHCDDVPPAVLQGERHRNVRLGYPQSMLETWPL